jgi:hypothetical protein
VIHLSQGLVYFSTVIVCRKLTQLPKRGEQPDHRDLRLF